MDRETVSSYRLKVAATDGKFVTEARVTIEILDDNDNPPICAHSFYTTSITEETYSGAYLLHIEATDADEGINAEMAFSISGQDADFFSVESETGLLKTALPLDREFSDIYRLTATVVDSIKPKEFKCEVEIEVMVTDINDNAPQ